MNRKLAVAAVIGTAAALVAGWAAGGAAGLLDVAVLATLGVLVGARGALRSDEPRSVRPKKQNHPRRPADFPAYASIASDVEWARMSRRHYQHVLRPRLARLATALGRPAPPQITSSAQIADLGADGPGLDLATLDRIVTRLEGP